MNIKCPNCQTAYVVPDEQVETKPKKMRCARCQEVFTVKRRSEKTPLGYQEFTGKQNALPQEFAFLRESRLPAAPADETPATAPKTGGAPPPLPVKKAPAATPPASGYEDFSQAHDFDELKTSPGLSPSPGLPSQPSIAAPIAAAIPAPVPQPEAAPAPQSRPLPSPRPAGTSQDLYGGNTWETEVPLDLGHYTTPSAKSQRVGKIVAGVLVAILLFFGFVAVRNGWRISLSSLPDQIAFAFSGGDYEELPATVDDLEVAVNERRLLHRSGSGSLVIVAGTVFNNSPVQRKSILLRGKLMDANGDVKGEVRVPCNKIFDDSDLKNTRPGQIAALYQKGGAVSDCTLRGESSTSFQMVFENVKADYDPSYTLDVKPVFAE